MVFNDYFFVMVFSNYLAGIPSGNFEVLACAKETVERLVGCFDQDLPEIDLILGQGSSPYRGLYFDSDDPDLGQYLLPFFHPSCELV